MSKPTHIIIPIKDIEDKIAAYKQKIEMCEENNINTHNFYRMQGFLTVYKELLDVKKLSLSEEDIEEKAWSLVKPPQNELYPEDSDGYNEFEVYDAIKRALKDLL